MKEYSRDAIWGPIAAWLKQLRKTITTSHKTEGSPIFYRVGKGERPMEESGGCHKLFKNWNPVNRLTWQECWVSTISDGCKDIRLSKSGKLGRQQHEQAAGCSLRARLLVLLADPSQVARYLLWRDVAAGASNTPLMSRAATVPPPPRPTRADCITSPSKGEKRLAQGHRTQQAIVAYFKTRYVHTRQVTLKYVYPL